MFGDAGQNWFQCTTANTIQKSVTLERANITQARYLEQVQPMLTFLCAVEVLHEVMFECLDITSDLVPKYLDTTLDAFPDFLDNTFHNYDILFLQFSASQP